MFWEWCRYCNFSNCIFFQCVHLCYSMLVSSVMFYLSIKYKDDMLTYFPILVPVNFSGVCDMYFHIFQKINK
jgi:hypothetical protein